MYNEVDYMSGGAGGSLYSEVPCLEVGSLDSEI